MSSVLGMGVGLAFSPLGAGGAFDPSIYALWLDASDLGTMFQERTGAAATTPSVVDGVVGSWQNKGTLGGWAVALADSSRPILRSAAGLYWLEFDGVDDYLSIPSSCLGLFRNVSLAMIAAGGRWVSGDTGVLAQWSKGDDASSFRVALSYGTGWKFGARRLDSDSNVSTTGQGADTSDRVLRGHLEYQNTDEFLYRDGALLDSNTSFQTAGTSSDTDSASGTIGASVDGVLAPLNFLEGRIYGIIADNLAASDASVPNIDAYLSGKAGVTL